MQWGHQAEAPLPSCAVVTKGYDRGGRNKMKILRHEIKMEEFDYHDRHGGSGDIEGLRALLRHKFGNAARGWRLAIAPHGDREGHDNGLAGTKVCVFSDFCLGLKKIGFAGNGKSCWKALSHGTNIAWLEDFDPTLANSLDMVGCGIAEHYPGGACEAFAAIEKEHGGRVNADEFEEFLWAQELLPLTSQVRTRQVFECLALSGRGTMDMEEFRFLDHWVARRLKRPLPEPPVVKEHWGECVHWHPPEPKPPHVPNLKDFRKYCTQHFGSPARAWRVCIDLKAQGTLSPTEFGMACRQMRWKHEHHPLYSELAWTGGGVASLRGLDPETCSAIDLLVEKMLPAFGDLETLWSEVLDRDGDGVCSKLEWQACLKRELGISNKKSSLIFIVLDIVHAGWLALTELGFLQDFVPDISQDSTGQATLHPGDLFASASTGSLPQMSSQQSAGTGFDTGPSWASTSIGGGSGKGGSGRSASTHELHLGSVQRSSRSQQNRAYANCSLAKYRWMGTAAATHTRSMSDGSAWHTLKKKVLPNMPTVGGTPASDIYRFTNEFYREGCRRLEYHTALQDAEQERNSYAATQLAATSSPVSSPQQSPKNAERHSPASSSHSKTRGGTPKPSSQGQ